MEERIRKLRLFQCLVLHDATNAFWSLDRVALTDSVHRRCVCKDEGLQSEVRGLSALRVLFTQRLQYAALVVQKATMAIVQMAMMEPAMASAADVAPSQRHDGPPVSVPIASVPIASVLIA